MTKQEKELLNQIIATNCQEASGKYNYKALNIFFKLLKQIMDKDSKSVDMCMEKLKWIMDRCQEAETIYRDWRNARGENKKNNKDCLYAQVDIDFLQPLYWQCVLQRSYWSFEDFIIYMERRREPIKQFYPPRRNSLKTIVDDLQALEDSKTQKMYGLSMPSRTGKSTICIFFLCWVAMKRPNCHSAMGGHSGTLTKGFYKELLNFMTTSEYEFERIYRFHHPEYADKPMITDRSAEDYTITLGDSDRFATITCRSIDSTWTGAIDVSDGGYLYVDDLVRDREHSLNPQRMENTWQEYLNKMVDRKSGSNRLGGAKELMVGTLWNIYDPLNRLKDIYVNDPQYVFRRIPALDYETDESNFAYALNGFSTQYYREMRERLDEAEWMAKYQQNPQIREGILFPRADMHRFSQIPDDGEVLSLCDPALGGGDFLSMPIIKHQEGSNKYKVVDWIYNNSSPKETVPKMVDKIIKWHIPLLHLEYNGGAGALVHKELTEELKKRDCLWCSVEPYYTSTKLSKEEKIKGRADFVKDNFEFLEDVLQEGEYKKAFSDMCVYTTVGKNLHDDAPDSVTTLALKIRPFSENGVISIPDINPFRSFGGRI